VHLQHTHNCYDGTVVTLNCFTLDWTAAHPAGFSCKTVGWQNAGPWDLEFQYDLRGFPGVNARKLAYRTPFLVHGLGVFSSDLTVSHLCHTEGCLNPLHVVLESLQTNQGRGGCPGPGGCHHLVPCLRPGTYHRGVAVIQAPPYGAHPFIP